MPRGRDIIVIGASAGGINVIRDILGGLPQNFAASLFVVLHLPQSHSSFASFLAPQLEPSLVQTLEGCCLLPLQAAVDGQCIQRGQVYFGVPNAHLLVERGTIRLRNGLNESLHKPSVDALFRSAAMAYGKRVVGVVLSGMLYDGTAGLWEIKRRGGTAIVQDPQEAQYPQMPESAIANVDVDSCLGSGQIAGKLIELAQERIELALDRGDRENHGT